MPTTFNVISLGNHADMDLTEGDNIADNAAALVGTTFGSEANPLVDDFVSFSPGTGGFDGGTAGFYDQDNSPAENFRIDGGADQVFDSAARFTATLTYTDGTTDSVNVAIFQDTAGNTYLAPETSQNGTQDALELAPIRSITLNSVAADTTQGLVANRDAFEFATCYGAGTLIDTPDGPRPVEDLAPGDLVLSLDHGPVPILWLQRQVQTLDDLDRDVRPVLIAAGALGQGRPSRDMVVSPQHRVLVGGQGQLPWLSGTEAFVSAKALVRLPGIRHMAGRRRVRWFHFVCAAHHPVRANGCVSESLYLGAMTVAALSPWDRAGLFHSFGAGAARPVHRTPARPFLRVAAARARIRARRLAQSAQLQPPCGYRASASARS